MRVIGNAVQRFLGAGPFAAGPFTELVQSRMRCTDRFAAGDWPDGVVLEQPADAGVPARSLGLLGQKSSTQSPAEQSYTSPVRRLFSLRDACVAGADGVVWCPYVRRAFVESVRRWHGDAQDHPLFSSPRFPGPQPLSGLSLNLGSLDAGGFYHFLHESLPRLYLARPFLHRIDHFLCPGEKGGFHHDWLTLAGVPSEKIIWLHGHTHWRCERLLFTNQLTEDSRPTPWLFSALRNLVGWRPVSGGTGRIWLSRRDAPGRHLVWEEQLVSRLPGFELVGLARRPAAEQVSLFASAEVIAGPHGAGFANLCFASPGARVVELLPDNTPRPLYARVAATAGATHAWASCDFTHPPADSGELSAAIMDFIAAPSACGSMCQ